MAATAIDEATTTTTLLDLPDHIIVENILTELFPSSLGRVYSNVNNLRDILSFASTCTRIHALSSHPSLWRGVNATVFQKRYAIAVHDGVAPPPLPLGAVHCGIFPAFTSCWAMPLLEMLHDLTDVRVDSCDLSVEPTDTVRAISLLPRLVRLEIEHSVAGAFSGVMLSSSQSLEYLYIHANGEEIVDFLSANSFPSLTVLEAVINSTSNIGAAMAAIVRSCPTLFDVTIRGLFGSAEVASLASGCHSLRKVTVCLPFVLTGHGVPSSVSCPHIRELVFTSSCRATGGFLSLFPGLVRLELRGALETEDDLKVIGGMTNLESLKLNGPGLTGEPSRRLLPLVTHPMTKGRPSLKSLSLLGFQVDLGDFLSSPWCSRLTKLRLIDCALSDSAVERLSAANGTTLSLTLRSLTLSLTDVDGCSVGRFITTLSSLEAISVSFTTETTHMSEIICGIGRSPSRVTQLQLSAPLDGQRIDTTPLLPVIANALDITISGNLEQSDVDSIAASCDRLYKFTIRTTKVITPPKSYKGILKYKLKI